MAFIKTRKKIVSSAIASSLSVIAMNAVAQEQVTTLETIHQDVQAEQKQSLKVDKSANTKYVAPLLDTPKSVSVISKQLIEDTQVTTLSDALRNVPGITLGAGEGGNPNGDRPFIRGFNSESSMYVDGVRSATSQNREMFAVEQVEVTKGSASAMGGAGTTGGSINMISKVAKKGDSLEGSVGAGTDDYQRITLDGNKDFGNGIAARVALMGHHNNKAGQGDDGAEYARVGIAPSITFGLDTPTRATVSYYYLKSDDTPDSGVPYQYDTSKLVTAGKPVDVPQGIYYGWKNRDFQKQENQIGTLKLEHDLTDNLTISNVAQYSNSKNNYVWTQPDDSQGNVAQGEVWRRSNSKITDTNTFTDQLSLTGKLNTGSLVHSFNTGVEYSKQDSDRGGYTLNDTTANGSNPNSGTSQWNVKPGGTLGACANSGMGIGADSNYWCTSLNNPNSNDPWLGSITANPKTSNVTTKNTSVYALDSIKINPQWILDLGIRWDKFETNLNNYATNKSYSSDNDFFNYQAGVTFKPVENGSIYASFATSSNPIGVDAGDGSEGLSTPGGRGPTEEQAIANNNLKPEDVHTMEIGTKWDLFNEKLNLTATIFRTEKTNTRATDTDGYTRNIGETRVDGLELGVNGNITNKWAVSAGYTYLDSTIVDDGPKDSNEGNQVQNVAKNSATLWTTYAFTPSFTLGAGAVAMDKVYGDAANTKFVPGYVRYDAMARYNVNKNVDLQLNVNNLSDKRYFTKAYASHYATEAEGRSAVLSVNFKY